jgi:hypothetical protein
MTNGILDNVIMSIIADLELSEDTAVSGTLEVLKAIKCEGIELGRLLETANLDLSCNQVNQSRGHYLLTSIH